VKEKNNIFSSLFFLLLTTVFFGFPSGSIADGSDVIINQIMIEDCENTKNEFIELYNNSDNDIILDGYKLIKKTKSGNKSNLVSSEKFKGTIPSKGYFLIAPQKYAPAIVADLPYSVADASIADDSTIILYDDQTEKNIVDMVDYGAVIDINFETKPTFNPPKGKSIERKNHKDTGNNFDDFVLSDSIARNTKSKTSVDGIKNTSCTLSENIDENISVEYDKNIYKNISADFDVDYIGSTDATKYTWTFGDGHKSYLQKTTHKYEEAGTYAASITIRGDKDAKKNFEVEVEEYEAPKVRIIRLSPNPKGVDTKNEWIEIQNDSKKKIDMIDWTIATGWDKLINHKITKKFVIKSKKSAKITSKYCAFTLNNIKNKIELRDPTGETVQKIKYNRKKDKIEDDEIFAISGKNWEWNKPMNNSAPEENNTELNSDNNIPPLPSGEDVRQNFSENLERTGEGSKENTGDIIIIPQSEIDSGIGKATPDISWQNKKDNRIILIGYGTTINTPVNLLNIPHGQVLGASDEKYFPPEKHWAVSLFDNSVRKINFGLNWVLSRI
jgi:hypothetical protein